MTFLFSSADIRFVPMIDYFSICSSLVQDPIIRLYVCAFCLLNEWSTRNLFVCNWTQLFSAVCLSSQLAVIGLPANCCVLGGCCALIHLPSLLCAFFRIWSESGAKMGAQANHNAIMYPLGITEHFYNCFYKRHTNDEIGSQFLGKFMLTSITNVILFE